MRRRDFLGAGMAAAAAAGAPLTLLARSPAALAADNAIVDRPTPTRIAGMTLRQLRDDFHHRLFDRYLPFWEKGGIDRKYGGFMCELNDDGTVASDEKTIWYQGRGIWDYAYLYNEFGRDPHWLEIARRGRDFMVKHMHAGGGRWYEQVARDGTLQKGVAETVYGWLFAAQGLAEYYRAVGDKADLDLAKQSIRAAVQVHDDPQYADTMIMQYIGIDVDPHGLRTQGHSMVLISILTDMLAHRPDAELEALQRRHIDLIMDKFWNPEYRIMNECLAHDYSRIPGADAHMLTGHAVESLWMVMVEAMRRKDRGLLETAAQRIRPLLEMCWDYVFDGWGDGDFRVFSTKKFARGPDYDIKTMWAHCEALNACMLSMEYLGEDWANRWYGMVRAFSLKAFAGPQLAVWRQAVDRRGKDLKRVGVSTKRKDNFHPFRYMMYNLLSLERMLNRLL